MAYLKIAPNREGRIYYYIEQGYREKGKLKKRTLHRIGRHDLMASNGDSDPLATAKLAVDEWNKNQGEAFISKAVSVNTESSTALLNLGHQVLLGIYDTFGISSVFKEYARDYRFEYDLNEIMKVLVLGRILDPASKSHTVTNFQNTLSTSFSVAQNDMDRSLDHFAHEGLKRTIQIKMHKSITRLTSRIGYLAFYDVTNYYFESDLGDPDILQDGTKTLKNKTQQKKSGIGLDQVAVRGLRRRGPSKEYRRDPIVQLGLFMDSNGIPISYELFAGNETDPLTYVPAIAQVKRQFGLERIVVVADKAMNSRYNVADAASRGDGWLFSQKVRGRTGVPKDIQEFALSPDDWEFSEDLRTAKKSMTRIRKVPNVNGKPNEPKTREIEEKVVVTWREKYAVREKKRRDDALEYATALTNPERFRRTMKAGGKRYVKMTLIDLKTKEEVVAHPLLGIDQDAINYDAQFDGLNVIVTSETKMSDEEVIAAYGELGKIEDCFRVSKSDLMTRPVFVWTHEHIEAHFLTCFIALTVLRYLQYKLGYKYSPKRIIDALSCFLGEYWAGGYWNTFSSDDTKAILGELGCDVSRKYLPTEVVTNLKRKVRL